MLTWRARRRALARHATAASSSPSSLRSPTGWAALHVSRRATTRGSCEIASRSLVSRPEPTRRKIRGFYFLYASPRPWLERLIFPLGESTKLEVRAEAVRRNLPGAEKDESQELCFVGGKPHAHAAFVADRAADRIRPGLIVDGDGAALGTHDGVHRFTVGQRKGLGVAAGRPVFVTRIDATTATVHVGDSAALRVDWRRAGGRLARRRSVAPSSSHGPRSL